MSSTLVVKPLQTQQVAVKDTEVSMRRVAGRDKGSMSGSVAIEFLFLFPVVMAMLYASAVYGIVFFSQYKLQDAVDRAVSAALYVDRSAFDANTLKGKVEERALSVLTEVLRNQSGSLSAAIENASCSITSTGLGLLECKVSYNYKEKPIVPVMSFGMLGTFPPVPDTLNAEARAAF